MRKIYTLLLLLLLLISSSCTSLRDITGSQLMNIRKGMTQNEVIALMKREPDYRRFDRDTEEWEYRGYGGFESLEQSALIVWFVDGRVDGMDSFKVPTPPSVTVAPPAAVVTPSFPNPGFSTLPSRPTGQSPHRAGLMTKDEFAGFVRSLKEGFMSERFKSVEKASEKHRFTSAQCKELVGLFSFTDEKIKVLRMLYPKVVDKENYSEAVNVLPFNSDRDKVWQAVKGTPR